MVPRAIHSEMKDLELREWLKASLSPGFKIQKFLRHLWQSCRTRQSCTIPAPTLILRIFLYPPLPHCARVPCAQDCVLSTVPAGLCYSTILSVQCSWDSWYEGGWEVGRFPSPRVDAKECDIWNSCSLPGVSEQGLQLHFTPKMPVARREN